MGKLVKRLQDVVKKMANDNSVKIDYIMKFIIDFYKLLCSKITVDAVEKKLSEITRNDLKEGNTNLYLIIEPFHNVSFESIRTAAKMLKVELDEYVTIKTDDGHVIKTDRPVPVGITYLQFLEHFSSQYASIGGAVKYSAISKQPVKIGGGGNVSTIGQLDINALITYEADNILQELLTARSDHHKIKRKIYSEIADTGVLYENKDDDKKMLSGGTLELKNIYMNALGLLVK